MSKEGEWQEGMPTHENIIFSCFGGLSNTGITSALACLEVVKELGLEKVAVEQLFLLDCSWLFLQNRLYNQFFSLPYVFLGNVFLNT